MRPIAITVCVNYSDFLCWSIPISRKNFKDWIIVTDTKDIKTQKLANNYGLKLIVTDEFYKNNDNFNKWNGINIALDYLKTYNKFKDEWILFLDSDIIIPPLCK